jgi:predicted alpha/beta hydrolase
MTSAEPTLAPPVSPPSTRPADRPAPAPAPAPVELSVTAGDGHQLAMRLFRVPAGTPARGAILLAAAMGVPQRFYEPLAQWLAARGFVTLTFDYRGMGLSRSGPLRDVSATIETWAELDTRAALQALAARADELPITWVGHSLGGQIVPFLDEDFRRAHRVQKIVTVAAGSGYWLENAPQLRRRVWLFWFGAVPLTTPFLGYFPGKRLGMVGDLPRGVIAQWRRWCLDREYAVGAEGPRVRALFAAVETPLTSLSFTDDEMMSAANIASLHGFYTSAPRSLIRLAPADVGVDKIGHFGFFRQERAPLWASHLLPELAVAADP